VVDHASGQLSEHLGTDPNSGWFPISTPGPVAQVSAGNEAGTDVVFARFTNGDVYEYYGTGGTWNNPGTFHQTKICSNAAEISASQSPGFPTVFVRKNDGSLSECTNGLFGVEETPLGRPSGVAGSASQISAGGGTSQWLPVVFVNFNGALYEHSDSGSTSTWTYVAGLANNPGNPSWLNAFAVTDFSASGSSNTVDVVNKAGTLTAYKGNVTSSGVHFSQSFIANGVNQVSASVDGSGNAAAFALKQDGTLWEYDYAVGSLWKIASNVTALAASQGLNQVVFETNSYPGSPYFYNVVEFYYYEWDFVTGWNLFNF
jgi:hypothetical protein